MLFFLCQLFLVLRKEVPVKEEKGATEEELLPFMKEWDKRYYFQFIEADKSNYGLISTYGHYEDWQPVNIVYPEKESRFVKKGKS